MGVLILKGLLLYAILLVFLFFWQRNMIYFPVKSRPDPESYGAPGIQIAEVVTEDGLALQGWYWPPATEDKQTIVLFHGNAAHYGTRLPKVAPYIHAGYGVLLAEYRGYGGNPGKPAEQGLYKDARAFLGWLRHEKSVPDSKIVLYGESLGSGVAVQMATEFNPAAVILEAPFSSAVDIARKMYFFIPVDLLLRDRYENKRKITDIKAPLLIVTGENDTIIPPENSLILFEAAPEPRYHVSLSGAGHNTMDRFGLSEEVLKFLEKL